VYGRHQGFQIGDVELHRITLPAPDFTSLASASSSGRRRAAANTVDPAFA
jgi:hypothetical protein